MLPCMYLKSSFGFYGRELKNFCSMTDMLTPVSNSDVVMHCWTVIWCLELIPYMAALLMIMATSVDSKSKLCDVKPEHWLKQFSKSSSSVVSCTGSILSVWLSCVKSVVSMTSFIATSCDLGESDRGLTSFIKYTFHLFC